MTKYTLACMIRNMKIKLLDQKTVARIAAGEVVERPASIIKELVENSLDAGATRILVEALGGGVNLLRVNDNGQGIPPEDIATAFQRHATSKLNRIEDLESIGTLGFRGEALPSIAAVAEVEIVTAINGSSAGAYLKLQNGVAVENSTQARPVGTTITVKHLFRNIPARLKFLKTASTENGQIANIVTQYALAYPEVKFTLSIEGRTTLATPGDGNLKNALMSIYGLETAKNMVPLNHEDGIWQAGEPASILVTGLTSSPVISRAGKSAMHFYVNRRAINNRVLSFAVADAYSGLLMQGRNPITILNIKLPPSQVDVNIHPAKTEVKFQDERAIFLAVQRAVRGALVKLAPVPKIEEKRYAYHEKTDSVSPALFETVATGKPTHSAPVVTENEARLPVLRVIGQIQGIYILAEGPDGLYIIDQHAAHERLAYEEVKQQWQKRGVENQGLLDPFVLEVSPKQAAILPGLKDEISKYGFTMEPFGDRNWLVRTVPAILAGGNWLMALREIIDEPAAGAARTDNILKSLACHSVVRAGQILSETEMKSLVQRMENATRPFTCPHGRPTLINLSIKQLEKEFGRS